MRNLLRHLFAHNRNFLLASALLLGGFQFLLCAIVASMNLESTLDQVLDFAPAIIRSMIEQSMMGGSTAGLLAFGWNHPITHALITAVAITLAARAVAGEIENGAIELVLTQPLSRAAYLASHVLFGLLAIALVAGGGALGTLIGQAVFELAAFDTVRLAGLLLNVVLLQAALYGVTLIASTFGREAGRVAIAGVLAAIVSYLTNVIATLWPDAAFLLPFSLHSYYDPRAILVTGGSSVTALLVLSGFAALCMFAAYRRFATRDLP